jgi:alpha-tubulin suppressor-like RCC1 family protein
MLGHVIYSCGSGSNRLLLQDNTLDCNAFQPSTLPYELLDLSTSGTITCAIDVDYNCYCFIEGSHVLLRKNALKVCCGWSHVLILTFDEVYSYGNGNHGQLGLGDVNDASVPAGLGISNATSIGCGFRTSFVVHPTGTYVFGENHKYQLGLGHKNPVKAPVINPHLSQITQITGGNKHSVAFFDHILYVWGNNSFGQLMSDTSQLIIPEKVELDESIRQIGSGWNNIVVLTVTGKVYTCGKGDLGQLGDGEYINRSYIKCIIENVTEIACGSEHTIVISNQKAYAWGWNEHGNLGTGDNSNKNTPIYVKDQPKRIYAGGAITYLII